MVLTLPVSDTLLTGGPLATRWYYLGSRQVGFTGAFIAATTDAEAELITSQYTNVRGVMLGW